MEVRFGSQYDQRAFLGAKLRHGWDRLTNAERNKSDAERLGAIEALAPWAAQLSQGDMRAKVEAWRELGRTGKLELESVIEEAFAIVREASRRTTGLYHYPEQLIGGLILVRGAVAEMATGEGKTIA